MSDLQGIAIDQNPHPKITHRDLFLVFARIGLMGFGGVTPWLRRVLVEERAWLDDREFAELFGFASTLPGANTVSVAVMLGDRHQGVSGTLAALCGLLVMPLLILAGVAAAYDQFSGWPDVKFAIGGAAAATAGLVIGNAVKMARNMRPDLVAYAIGGAAFLAAGVLQLPLLWTLTALVPTSIAIMSIRNGWR